MQIQNKQILAWFADIIYHLYNINAVQTIKDVYFFWTKSNLECVRFTFMMSEIMFPMTCAVFVD